MKQTRQLCRFFCKDCNIFLCFNDNRQCFLKYHMNSTEAIRVRDIAARLREEDKNNCVFVDKADILY